MDETPVYIDMVSPTTLDFIGNKNVDGTTTGNEKSRFTVAITVSASGIMLKAYVIFKGLKNVPKISSARGYCGECICGWLNERRADA